MDPLSGVTTLATIIGLLCTFRQERAQRKASGLQEFLAWLDYHRHEEIKNLITGTAALRSEIEVLLQRDHAVIFQKLDNIASLLATLMSRLEDFKGLTLAVVPKAGLSDQAVSILRQFAEREADYFYYVDFDGGRFALATPDGCQIEINEPRFLRDDLDRLVGLGFLTRERSSQTTNLYYITRDAVSFLREVETRP